jgi:hypothetical protein
MTATVTEKTPKIKVDQARELCQDAILVKGEGYVCPADAPGLVRTALEDSDYNLADSLLDLIGDQGFSDAFRSSSELQEIIDLDAAWYFQGADLADQEDETTWEAAAEAGQKHYETCWEEYQAEGSTSGMFQDPAVYDNFSI